MYRILFLLSLSLLLPLCSFADGITGRVVSAENDEPITGAYLIWVGTMRGAVTDLDGAFETDQPADAFLLAASCVGYQSDTLDVRTASPLVFRLRPLVMDEVTVSGRLVGSKINRLSALATIDMNSAELCKAACCNLGESFETNASVDVNYADAATGARTIQMLGLSGRYVQMLVENVPNLRGLAAPYGLSYVPGPWMDGIQVSKGVGTVVNGYEAFTGQINIEYKKPTTDELVSANVFAASNGRVEANANLALRLTPRLSTSFMVNASDDLMAMDENDDGFRDEPQVRQLNLLNRWHYRTADGGYNFFLTVKSLSEERRGGHVDFSGSSPRSDLFGVNVRSQRVESWMKNAFIFSESTNIGIATGYIYHDQKSFFGLRICDASQHSYNVNAIFNTHLDADGWLHEFHAGLSSQGDFLDEQATLDAALSQFFAPSLDDVSVGAFAQYTLKKSDVLTLIAGLRADHNSNYDFFLTPRLHLRFAPSERSVIRAAVGKGYRTAALLAENNFLLSSARRWEISDFYGQESAWNMGVNLTRYIDIAGNELTLNAEYYHTAFVRQMTTDMDVSPRLLVAGFSSDRSFADNVQVEAKYSPLRGLELSAAWRWNSAKQTLGGELRQRPLVSRYKGLFTASYATPLKTWQFDANVQFAGGGRVPTTEGNPLAYQRSTSFSPYQLYNAQVTKWFRNWSLYVGCENIANFMQSNPIIAADDPFGRYFDASLIWGPLMSRKFYFGVRFALTRDDDDDD
ncbi:MAG: TonB-dependent receptor [Bacteroidales bacterium]|nr:TonB-dependent receptor [Bacteroidales bacterium]